MGNWYILYVRTGKEKDIKKYFENRINEEKEIITRIVIPEEKVLRTTKNGKKEEGTQKFLPGYILIEINEEFDNEITWHRIKSTPNVFGFLGAGERPVPLKEEEKEKILREIEERKSKALPKVEYKIGDRIRVIEGPFIDFTGIVEEVYPERERLKVSVTIFGRSTSLELDFWQVEKIT